MCTVLPGGRGDILFRKGGFELKTNSTPLDIHPWSVIFFIYSIRKKKCQDILTAFFFPLMCRPGLYMMSGYLYLSRTSQLNIDADVAGQYSLYRPYID